MKIIVPMAGRGSRLRPHTLTIPKPLIPLAGKPIVQRLVEDIANLSSDTIDEIAFIIGDFGKEVEDSLMDIAKSLGAKGRIFFQEEALGTAHAVLCAKESLKGEVVVAFADTLFSADFNLDTSCDGVIWVKKVDDPSAFGVVKLDAVGTITDFIEKPDVFITDLAIIGIYFFRNGENLASELQYLIDNNIKEKGEYQLTNALENMKSKGANFKTGKVNEWLDCGNKDITVKTHKSLLELNPKLHQIADSANITDSVIISPCFIGENVKISRSIIGPFVSIGNQSEVVNSNITNSMVQSETKLNQVNLDNSMVGNHVKYEGKTQDLSIGDYTVIKE